MSYRKPDVSVFINLPDESFNVPIPTLLPCVIGEHYEVVRDAYAGFSRANESTTIPYPNLSSSYNDQAQDLEVDLTGDFAPKVMMSLDATGEEVDITDKVTLDATGITVPEITETKDGSPYTGAVFVSYRALSDEYSGTNLELLRASSTEELQSLFGSEGIAPANPLGFGMFQALQHGQVAVSGVAVGSTPDADGSGTYQGTGYDTLLAHQYVLDYLRGQDVYALIPMTNSTFILDAILAHVEFMSSDQGKSERHLFFTPSFDEWWPVRTESNVNTWYPVTAATTAAQDALSGGSTEIGNTVTDGPYTVRRIGTEDGSAVGDFIITGVEDAEISTSPATITFNQESVEVEADQLFYLDINESLFEPSNQRIRLADSVNIGDADNPDASRGDITELAVGELNSLASVSVATGVAPDYNNVESIQFLRERSGFELVEGIRDMARGYGNDRLTLVGPEWVSTLVNGDETDVKSYYAAAQLAGEVCRVGQQQAGPAPGAEGLTAMRDSIEKPWLSSRYFDDAKLNTAAGGGFTWLVNDQKGLPLRTRHTLTTDMSTVETQETVLSVERDFLARTYRRAFRPMLQKFRIDDTLLQTVAVRGSAINNRLSSPDSSARTFRSVSVESVEQNEQMPDTVNIRLSARHLYVLNNIEVTVDIVI